MPKKHRTEWKRISTRIPETEKSALDRITFLLDITTEEALREALGAYLPVLKQRVDVIMEGHKLPSVV